MENLNLQLVYSICAMMILTVIVAFKMFFDRFSEMKTNKISAQMVSVRQQSTALLKNTKSADNFLNLFETPVLFYVTCLTFLVLKNATPVCIVLAWIYVISRYVHSYIHCTYNFVMHRFYAYVISFFTLVLFIFTLVIALF